MLTCLQRDLYPGTSAICLVRPRLPMSPCTPVPLRRLLRLAAIVAVLVLWVVAQPSTVPTSQANPEDWPRYLGADARTHYSPLAQVNPGNVTQLVPVWSYREPLPDGETPPPWRSNPLVVNGEIFAVTPGNQLVSLNGFDGAENWRVQLPASLPETPLLGLAHQSGKHAARLFVRTSDRLLAVAALDGTPADDFGSGGHISLAASAPTDPGLGLAPPTLMGKSVIITDNCIRSYDTTTGRLNWIAGHQVPASHPLAIDTSRSLLYATTTTDRIICLNFDNGAPLWTHDLPAETAVTGPPVVFTLHRGGQSIPALAASTASGSVLLFNRLTGAPLLPASGDFSLLPAEDAKAAAIAPAIDPNNSLYLAARGLPFAAAELASPSIRWRSRGTRANGRSAPIVTGGNLAFRATNTAIEAIDARSGTMLWSDDLTAGSSGTPVTYRVNGRQYIAIPSGSALLAYALPLEVIAKPVAVTRPFARFEESISRIEQRLANNPPTANGIAFLGSSTFTRWDVDSAFPQLPVVNLGFGGSQIRDINHFAARILPPAKPSIVVFYCGNNDIGANFSFAEVRHRYRTFTAWMDEHLPDTHVVVLSNLPTPRRWAWWPDLFILNQIIAAETASHPQHHFVDGTHIMLDPDGRLRLDRISSDNLHLNRLGNAAMADTLRPVITALWQELKSQR